MKQVLDYLMRLTILTIAAAGLLYAAASTGGVTSLYLATAGWTALVVVWHHPLSLMLQAAQRALHDPTLA